MKIEIEIADAFFAGGNYDRIHLVNADKTFDDLSGQDAFWFVKVRKGTPSHERIQRYFYERRVAAPNDKLSDSAGETVLAALGRELHAEMKTMRELEDHCVHDEDRSRARLRSCLLGDIARAVTRAANDPKLSDRSPEGARVSTAARGTGADSARAKAEAESVTGPVGLEPSAATERQGCGSLQRMVRRSGDLEGGIQ